jgi:predicted ATP-grasp superfamily ATP-dependent carboligase
VHSVSKPLACVVGDVSLVRALGRRGIPVALATNELGSSATLSRYCHEVVPLPSFVDRPHDAVSALVQWAETQREEPVLFYQGDHDLLAISRHRSAIRAAFRCVLPRAELVEDLVDKLRFADLAARLRLPTPHTLSLRRGDELARAIGCWERFPCVLKPATRSHWFGSRVQVEAIGSNQKAVRVESREQLTGLLPLLAAHQTDFVLQEAVEGAEDRILSYHAYVRPGGELVGEFTGKKVRTAPRRYGISTYVEITEDSELRALGRDLVRRLSFSGVLKADFKKDMRDERISLLEVNPRFNLWHHPATIAGACIPELVYQDCVAPRSARTPLRIRPGVRWMNAREDLRSYDEHHAQGGLSLGRWMVEAVTADVKEDLCLIDPLPGLSELVGVARRKLLRLAQAVSPLPATRGEP